MVAARPQRSVGVLFPLAAIAAVLLSGCERPAADSMVVRDALLLTAEGLQQRLADKATRILDVRDQDAYQAGHIPGAVRVDADAWETRSFYTGGLQDQAFWSEAIGRLGVDRDTRIVVYGGNLAMAARIWWLLKYCGLPHAALLDGGWSAWQQAGGAVETETPAVAARSFSVVFQERRLADAAWVLRGTASVGSGPARGVVLLDVRSPDEYTGRRVLGSRPGHIPGAVHLDWNEFLDETGRFRSPADLENLLSAKGIKREATVAPYCYSGARSSAIAFTLERLGFPHVKNYYAGWRQWSQRSELPAEAGSP